MCHGRVHTGIKTNKGFAVQFKAHCSPVERILIRSHFPNTAKPMKVEFYLQRHTGHMKLMHVWSPMFVRLEKVTLHWINSQ